MKITRVKSQNSSAEFSKTTFYDPKNPNLKALDESHLENQAKHDFQNTFQVLFLLVSLLYISVLLDPTNLKSFFPDSPSAVLDGAGGWGRNDEPKHAPSCS
jgi:hypothetical protein